MLAGGNGQLSARIIQELLRGGFKVTAGKSAEHYHYFLEHMQIVNVALLSSHLFLMCGCAATCVGMLKP